MNSLRFPPSRAADLRHRFSKIHAGIFAFGAILLTPFTHAATVSGRVLNQATGDSLPGAIVQVDGSSIGTVTERGGTFSLSLPEGSHTLVVSFSGLDTARVPVTVGAGSVAKDIELTSGVYKLDAYSVKGVREGSALAIQAQRLSENPKWVAATDTFGNPAANPGELIQRLPGLATDI